MMAIIQHFDGNAVSALLDGKIDILVHCCNPYNVFGAGIAREIRERIPAAYAADTEYHESVNGDLSQVMGVCSFGGNVYNCYGQRDYTTLGRATRQVHYGYLCTALACVADDIRIKIESGELPESIKIGFPYKFASDLAGGDWDTVLEIIEGIFFGLNVHIYKLTR